MPALTYRIPVCYVPLRLNRSGSVPALDLYFTQQNCKSSRFCNQSDKKFVSGKDTTMFKKKWIVLSLITAAALLTACGKTDKKEAELVGPLSEIMDSLYENADLPQDFRDSLANYSTGEIPAESAEYLIGTTDVAYEESYFSVPMINAVAYQCILLRLPEDTDMEAAKQTLADHADPRKWVCVEAESVIVENVGNVVLFIMGDSQVTNAMSEAFKALGGE